MWLHLFFNILLPLAVLAFLNRAIYKKLHQVEMNQQLMIRGKLANQNRWNFVKAVCNFLRVVIFVLKIYTCSVLFPFPYPVDFF